MTRGEADVAGLSDLLRARLAAEGTPERAAGEQRYLKSSLIHLGVPVPVLRTTTRQVLRGQHLDPAARDALVMRLWGSGVYELRRAAVEVLAGAGRDLSTADLALVERLLSDANTWALVDPLSIDVAGAVALGHADAGTTFARWITDDRFWVRRAALLAHVPLLRADPAQFDRFATLADRVLDEREFFIRKAIGWVLREVGRRAPERVVAWLGPRTTRASGVTMREAVKHLPAADAARLMDAYRARR